MTLRSFLRIVLWLFLALILAAFAAALGAQEPPNPAPAPTAAIRIDWRAAAASPRTALAVDAFARGLDAYSTRRADRDGHNHEMFLPDAISGHASTMVAYGAAVVTVDWLASHELRRRGHRRLADLLIWIDASQDMVCAGHNLTLHK